MLTQYLNQTRRLLHDANANYWSTEELTDDINQARKRISLDSGNIRSLLPFYLSSGQEAYPYNGSISKVTTVSAGTGFTSAPAITFSGGGGTGATATASLASGGVSGITIISNGTGFTAAPTVVFTGGGGTGATATASILSNILDIMNVTVNWGNSWVNLPYTYFTQFQTKARYYRSVTGEPVLWTKGPPQDSTIGGDWFYIFQIPSMSYQAELDCTVTTNDLVDDTTVEQLGYPYTDVVQYFAAYLAKFKQQKFDEAAGFLKIYDELMRRGTAAKYQRRIPNPYA